MTRESWTSNSQATFDSKLQIDLQRQKMADGIKSGRKRASSSSFGRCYLCTTNVHSLEVHWRLMIVLTISQCRWEGGSIAFYCVRFIFRSKQRCTSNSVPFLYKCDITGTLTTKDRGLSTTHLSLSPTSLK